MCIFIIFTVICAICVPDIRGLTANQSLGCTSELIFSPSSPEGQNASVPNGVNISVQFRNFEAANQSAYQDSGNVTDHSNVIIFFREEWPLDRFRGNQICISLDSTLTSASADDISCYKPCVPAYSVVPRLLYTGSPPELQLSLNGGEWMSICDHGVEDLPSDTMDMICQELGYHGVAEWTTVRNYEYYHDSVIELKCPNNSSRVTDCQTIRGRCKSNLFISLTCQIEIDKSRGFTWSIPIISLVSTAAGLLFLLLLSLIAHLCRCCSRNGPSEVLVTYVKKNKTSFRNQAIDKERTVNSSLLLQLPSLSQENLDNKTSDKSTREKNFMGSSERIYFDIAETPCAKSTIEVGDQSYQVDEDGYAKPLSVMGSAPVFSSVTSILDAKTVTSKPVTKPKPKSVSKLR